MWDRKIFDWKNDSPWILNSKLDHYQAFVWGCTCGEQFCQATYLDCRIWHHNAATFFAKDVGTESQCTARSQGSMGMLIAALITWFGSSPSSLSFKGSGRARQACIALDDSLQFRRETWCTEWWLLGSHLHSNISDNHAYIIHEAPTRFQMGWPGHKLPLRKGEVSLWDPDFCE